jgi:hypothetical protein
MNDPERVRLRRADAGLEDEVHRLFHREGAALFEPLRKVVAFEELHDHVRSPLGQGSDVDRAADVLALDPHDRLRLAQKPGDCPRVPRHLGP